MRNEYKKVHTALAFRQYAYLDEGEVQLVPHLLISIKQRVCFSFHSLHESVLRWIKPPTTSLVLGTFADLTRSKAELLAENALLRQQVIILRRQVKHPCAGYLAHPFRNQAR